MYAVHLVLKTNKKSIIAFQTCSSVLSNGCYLSSVIISAVVCLKRQGDNKCGTKVMLLIGLNVNV